MLGAAMVATADVPSIATLIRLQRTGHEAVTSMVPGQVDAITVPPMMHEV